LNPRTLRPMASTLTITPPRRLNEPKYGIIISQAFVKGHVPSKTCNCPFLACVYCS
jgi:hypothetical protein